VRTGPAPRLARLLSLALLAAASAGCRRTSEPEARGLVERYNRVVSEAYRRGDVKLVDPVVGPREGKKLTGLIGVRLDLGLTLDSELLSLDVTGVEREGGSLRVFTRETWRYRDRRIGDGEQVGDEARDEYEMQYTFVRQDGAWVVDDLKFSKPPLVGRKTSAWRAPPEALHGVRTSPTSRPAQEPPSR
jgi:hypothetical protein